ncbi:MAG: PorV/PorQ family protein [Flavobacteriales bacterium]|nr:PorV/PorQ family protein [Flavobacteriales bacterium]
MTMTMQQRMLGLTLGVLTLATVPVQAGNPDRAGSAGAAQLLINPWARSAGWGLANSAALRGVEGMFGNVAGLAHTRRTEVVFTTSRWLEGSGVKINSIGLGQKLGETGALGISVMTMAFGDIPVTTVDQPDGGLGTFRTTQSNFAIAYAKGFSNSIYGGLLVRVVSESIADARTTGFCFDAGINYVTGERDQIRFGIALKNVGPAMRYAGDGMAVQGVLVAGSDQITLEQRSQRFELPSMLTIGGAYDFKLGERHGLTAALSFNSNSFTRDQFVGGLEYGFRRIVHLRVGYMYEEDITNREEAATVFTGLSGGLSLDMPFGKEKLSTIGLDYAYRATNPWSGVHQIGVRISL